MPPPQSIIKFFIFSNALSLNCVKARLLFPNPRNVTSMVCDSTNPTRRFGDVLYEEYADILGKQEEAVLDEFINDLSNEVNKCTTSGRNFWA
ncbi:unnamed protein product [Caenorhabditis nigoni]